jgi:hypothetical protein
MNRNRDDDATGMSPDARCTAIAKVLAAGVVRLQSYAAFAVAPASANHSGNPDKSARDGLEVSGETRLNVHTG